MNDKEINKKVLKLLDEILNKDFISFDFDHAELKEKINTLSNQELAELIQLYSEISKYEGSTEKKEVPEFYLYRVKDYYTKKRSLETKGDLPQLVIHYIKNTLKVVQSSIELNVQEIPISSYRGDNIKSNKVILKDKKVEFSFIPQEKDSVMLSIFLENLTGSLTLKLLKENYIIDIKHFSNLNEQERINIEDLTYGNYVLDLKGSYNKKFSFVIQD